MRSCSPTLSEQFADSEVAILVEWVSARNGGDGAAESTTFEIVKIERDACEGFKKGQRITLKKYHAGKPGSLALLLGKRTGSDAVKWVDKCPLDINEESFEYIVQSPSRETPDATRLEYFVGFLEHSDATIAEDAYAEFAYAWTADIAAITSKLPRDKLRQWLLDEDLSPGRQEQYGLMLGLCGKKEDAQLLERRIFESSGEGRWGIEGVIAGYLLLTGEEGLDLIEREFLRNPRSEVLDIFRVQSALIDLWSVGNGRISNDRLKAALRLILKNPDFTVLVISNLARWKDWSIHSDLTKMYDDPKFDDKQIRRAIVRFMIASTKDIPSDAGAKLPIHARQGAEFIERLRKLDPKIVAEVERFFYVD
ncbi:MAG: hypothetical protein EXS05_15520 [Planctomycetaceae bacterium]|nr:hypothetical protein [Planctomycetaceae bacterium]